MSREAEHAKALPCPWCGSPTEVATNDDGGSAPWVAAWVRCTKRPGCEAEGTLIKRARGEGAAAEAVARWNEVVGAGEARNAALATCEIISTERDNAVRRMIQLEVGSGLLREALEGVLPLTEDHDRVCATRRQMPDCDCGWTITAERSPELSAARSALSTDAGQRAAAVLKAARKWRNEFRSKGSARTTPAMVFAESDLLQAIDALDGRA